MTPAFFFRVTPAKAGVQLFSTVATSGTPAFAGVTGFEFGGSL